MTLLADLFYVVAIILMVVCLAVGNAKPTDNFSWSAPSLRASLSESQPLWDVVLSALMLTILSFCCAGRSSRSTSMSAALNVRPTHTRIAANDRSQDTHSLFQT